MRIGAVLLAAGTGRRFGSARPKQFLKMYGRPLFAHSLQTFLSTPRVKEVILVVPSRDSGVGQISVKALNFPNGKSAALRRTFTGITDKRVRFIAGGRFRGESVRNGVRALSEKVDVILIHDTARPLVSRDIIERVARAAFESGVALAAWPLPDTLKWVGGSGRVKKTIPRKNLWLAQTPQGFRRNIGLKCLLKPSRSATDDVELAQRNKIPVRVVEGAPTNMKVTFQRDLEICEAIIRKK